MGDRRGGTVAYMNGFGDLMCDPDYELSLYHDQMGRGCGGPWSRVTRRLANTWYEDLYEVLEEELRLEENIESVTSGIDPACWLDLTCGVRCSVCGARIDSKGGD